ncbi:MAG TPA: hypothetical protein P5055_08950 [Candidatus Paceibacterota bacterium]|nr:hypothetical protein [Candidatus Paceibacterota bacterium]
MTRSLNRPSFQKVQCFGLLIQNILSLLVGLAPLLFVAALPVFMVALRTRCFRWLGIVGCLLLLTCAYSVVTDNPHARPFDSIDHGFLTGIPTLLVLLTSTYILILMSALLWQALRKIKVDRYTP